MQNVIPGRDLTNGPSRRGTRRPDRSYKRTALFLLPVAAVGLTALVATAGPSLAGTPRHAAAAAEVKVATVAKFGKILENSAGLPLYFNTANKPGKWACTGNCLTAWPPLLVPKGKTKAIGGPGVMGLGTVKSPSGLQVTWERKALYTFIKDSKGQVTGNGVQRVWHVAQVTAGSTTATTKGSTTATTKSAWS